MRAWVAQHRKLIAAIAGALVTVAVQVWGTNTPWITALILVATAAGVYRAPNADPVAAPAAPALPSAAGGGGSAQPHPAVSAGLPPSGAQ